MYLKDHPNVVDIIISYTIIYMYTRVTKNISIRKFCMN